VGGFSLNERKSSGGSCCHARERLPAASLQPPNPFRYAWAHMLGRALSMLGEECGRGPSMVPVFSDIAAASERRRLATLGRRSTVGWLATSSKSVIGTAIWARLCGGDRSGSQPAAVAMGKGEVRRRFAAGAAQSFRSRPSCPFAARPSAAMAQPIAPIKPAVRLSAPVAPPARPLDVAVLDGRVKRR